MKNVIRIGMCTAVCSMSALILFSCTTTQMRAFIRRDASVNDYTYFPSRVIPGGTEIREFTNAPDPAIENSLKKELRTSDIPGTINRTKTQALIIIKGNTLVLERYGKGYSRESTVTSFSVAKSINSAMTGCLIEDGHIKSIDEPITDFIPELKERDARFENITIKNLLNMSSGIVYEETPNVRADNTETYFNPDLRKLALTRTEIKENPGIHFLYNNYNPLLAGLIIERATGETVSSYMSRVIWSRTGTESDASWSLDSTEDAYEKMESGINARAIDFARFGCLYRDNRKINGRQIISPEWIAASLAEGSTAPDYYSDSWGKQIRAHGGYYGLGWYIVKRNNAANDFFAFGNKGQILYVSPAADIVIARFGRQYGMEPWKYLTAFYNVCTQYIQ
jgi:CubicO group peptidase (beta-lactamase class C family)